MGLFKKLLAAYFRCWRPHVGKSPADAARDFCVPSLNGAFLTRLVTIIIAGFLVFNYLLRPCFIKGGSMEPTYPRLGFDFCWRGQYWFSQPKRGDIVIIRFTRNTLLLKRIVALPGETVEFRQGRLFINGRLLYEPYVKYECDWNLPPRRVKPGHYYAVGDNRSMSISRQKFGQFRKKRIYGGPLW
ncbi:signal peptidase I [Lentisphaerota bacterium ZTH]|nr:signal peptidase I [Lentisphaerota bacterium]WET05769.1 signal peptidase I [Lentisphaerota bacterium ZTH]